MKRTHAAAIASAAAIALVLLVVLVARWASHGLTVDWYGTVDGVRHRIVRTVERRVEFRNERRPLARYVDHWDERKLGLPGGLPAIDAVFRGSFTVPEGAPRSVRLVHTGSGQLFIDGRRSAGEVRVEPGRHTIRIEWRSAIQAPDYPNWDRSLTVHMRVVWDVDGRDEIVPDSAFTPVQLDDALAWIWGIGVALVLLIGLWVLFVFRVRGESRSARGFALACLLLTCLAVPMRAYEYTAAPDFRSNMDELFNMWNGWQLLEDGTSRGWSLWNQYYGSEVTRESYDYWREQPIGTIQPYFEHPPLFHMMAGAVVRIGGAEHFTHAKHAHARLLPIALSIIAMWLCIAIGRRLGGRGAALLGGLLHAVMPIVSLQSRTVKGDALVTVLLPASVLLYLRWRESRRRRELAAAAFVAGLAVLAKIPAIAILVALGALLVMEKRYRDLALFSAVGLATSSLLLLYAATDWGQFWHAQEVQGTIRQVSPDVFSSWVLGAQIDHNRVGRPMLLFLWLAFAVACGKWGREKAAVLVVPLLAYVVALALPSGTWHYGWYLLPLYPILCAGAGSYLRDLWAKPDLLGGFLVAGLLSLYALQLNMEPAWVNAGANFGEMRRLVWVLALLLLVPFGFAQVFGAKWAQQLGRAGVFLSIVVFVVCSARFTLLYDVTSRTLYDYDWGKAGVPVEGGRRDSYTEDFDLPFGS